MSEEEQQVGNNNEQGTTSRKQPWAEQQVKRSHGR